MTKNIFHQDDLVYLVNLGENTPGRYKAKVVGLASEYPDLNVYIVELLDKVPGYNNWSHGIMVDGCMELCLEETIDFQ